MSRPLTFCAAKDKLANLATTSVDIGDAIQEAVDRIYEMGRWAGTTVEVSLAESDFVFDSDVDAYFVSFDEAIYDGAIGFRDAYRGWSIMDQTSLYKDEVNAGDKEFIDMGTVTVDGGGYDVLYRKYRAPFGWVADAGTYFALMKLESPTLEDDDIITIQSLGALKCAVKAVCYEYVSDDERATAEWSKFMQMMVMAAKQTEGPKKFYIGTDSSLRRKPNQFM